MTLRTSSAGCVFRGRRALRQHDGATELLFRVFVTRIRESAGKGAWKGLTADEPRRR
jgi:hypothetical protein